MRERWHQLEQRYARLSRRERTILLAGGMVVILLIGFSLLDSSLARQRLLAKELDKVGAETAMSQAQSQVIVRQLAEDPDARARNRIAELSRQTQELDQQVQSINRGLVPARQMADILQKMLARDARVKIVSLKTLPVSPLIDGKQAVADGGVYKHGIEFTLQGRYLDMLGYLERLEALPWQMFWSEAQMDARDYRAVRITVTVFTLSLDRDWLVV